MARSFTSAKAAFQDLLDRHEAQPLTGRLDAYVDHDGLSSITDYDRFAQEAQVAEKAGAISCRYGKNERSGQIVAIRLMNPEALYGLTGRVPAGDRSAAAIATVKAAIDLPPALEQILPEVARAWSRNKSWAKLAPLATDELIQALQLAKAILEERHRDLDYRTFSRRFTGDTKALEQLEGAVARVLGTSIDRPPGISPRDVLAGIGLAKFSPPLLISGPVATSGFDPTEGRLPYIGLPPEFASSLHIQGSPSYLLTIENFASFQRHANEVNVGGDGLVIYTGGFPSRAIQAAIISLVARLPEDVPVWHWSDIDEGGVGIFRTIERALGAPLRPHLMSVDLAERLGNPLTTATGLKSGAASGSLIAELWDYLAGPNARTLEQEELDPEAPAPPPET